MDEAYSRQEGMDPRVSGGLRAAPTKDDSLTMQTKSAADFSAALE
jgi:hypothetical protein